MKRTKKKLDLNKETVRELTPEEQAQVDGGTLLTDGVYARPKVNYVYTNACQTNTCPPGTGQTCYCDGGGR